MAEAMYFLMFTMNIPWPPAFWQAGFMRSKREYHGFNHRCMGIAHFARGVCGRSGVKKKEWSAISKRVDSGIPGIGIPGLAALPKAGYRKRHGAGIVLLFICIKHLKFCKK